MSIPIIDEKSKVMAHSEVQLDVIDNDRVEHNYLPLQFSDAPEIWAKIRKVVERGDFTLGKELTELEEKWALYCGTNHAVGVNSGTDALILIMKALGITGIVLVPAFSFVASAATVELAGANIRFVDVGEDFNIDPNGLEAAITPGVQAIMPVHWAGHPCRMAEIRSIALKHDLYIIEDACHAIGAKDTGSKCGALGDAAAFSLHPLKNVNVWGDGGIVTTDDGSLAEKIKKLRNHGLIGRNCCEHWGHNSRLDTVQAVVASHVLDKLNFVIKRRRENAFLLDALLAGIGEIKTPAFGHGSTYYLYSIRVQNRDALATYLNDNGIDAKVHYPVPLHLQPAAAHLGYKRGDFPGAESACDETLSLPIHEFVNQQDLERMASLIGDFYG